MKTDSLSVHEREPREPPHPRTVDTVQQNAEALGARAGAPAAEAFEMLREIRCRVYSWTNILR